MLFSPSQIPAEVTSVEALLAWCVQILASKNYSAIELSNTSGPVAPFYDRISRSPSGPNYGVPYLEFGGFIELNPETYPPGTAYEAAVPVVPGDTIPARFAA